MFRQQVRHESQGGGKPGKFEAKIEFPDVSSRRRDQCGLKTNPTRIGLFWLLGDVTHDGSHENSRRRSRPAKGMAGTIVSFDHG
jgi:hypothetical protein